MPLMKKRERRVYSISDELIHKSREAALTAVQIFNNPQIKFKSETFILLMNIAWTYILHAYYRKQKIEYRYFEQKKKSRRFARTAKGAYKFWELERCLNEIACPVDRDAANNLRFLIGIRHEIEHQMTTQIDASFSAKFQACCLNYNDIVKKLFGDEYSIERQLSFSLQFSSISKEHIEQLAASPSLPAHIKSYIEGFEENLTTEEYNSPRFAYRVLFVPKIVNKKGQADEVIEFVKPNSEFANEVNKKYALIKEIERVKYKPKSIVSLMKKEGFKTFSIHDHSELWKNLDAKNPAKGFGVQVENEWFWYENWVDCVRTHCHENVARFKDIS